MVKFLSRKDGADITAAIRQAENGTSGEIRVHIGKKCAGDPLLEARRVFKKLGMHRTKRRNGVLIFVSPESRQFAIVGDAGIHEKSGGAFWDSTRDLMLGYFRLSRIKEGIVAGVLSVGTQLRVHFPAKASDVNELSDAVTQG